MRDSNQFAEAGPSRLTNTNSFILPLLRRPSLFCRSSTSAGGAVLLHGVGAHVVRPRPPRPAHRGEAVRCAPWRASDLHILPLCSGECCPVSETAAVRRGFPSVLLGTRYQVFNSMYREYSKKRMARHDYFGVPDQGGGVMREPSKIFLKKYQYVCRFLRSPRNLTILLCFSS